MFRHSIARVLTSESQALLCRTLASLHCLSYRSKQILVFTFIAISMVHVADKRLLNRKGGGLAMMKRAQMRGLRRMKESRIRKNQ